jgi:CTP synthase (UTP-ammonia lyase)
VLITEIGGTTGDIEGLPFLEAIRQFQLEAGSGNVLVMHVTLIPYIKAAGELKTKPTQQSVAKLREIGLQPQVIICRTEMPLDAEVRQKLSLFCNVPIEAVIEAGDVEHTIYEAPLNLQAEGLDEYVCRTLNLQTSQPDMSDWRKFVERVVNPKKSVRIAVVGKYIELQDAYKASTSRLRTRRRHHGARILSGRRAGSRRRADKYQRSRRRSSPADLAIVALKARSTARYAANRERRIWGSLGMRSRIRF